MFTVLSIFGGKQNKQTAPSGTIKTPWNINIIIFNVMMLQTLLTVTLEILKPPSHNRLWVTFLLRNSLIFRRWLGAYSRSLLATWNIAWAYNRPALSWCDFWWGKHRKVNTAPAFFGTNQVPPSSCRESICMFECWEGCSVEQMFDSLTLSRRLSGQEEETWKKSRRWHKLPPWSRQRGENCPVIPSVVFIWSREETSLWHAKNKTNKKTIHVPVQMCYVGFIQTKVTVNRKIMEPSFPALTKSPRW